MEEAQNIHTRNKRKLRRINRWVVEPTIYIISASVLYIMGRCIVFDGKPFDWDYTVYDIIDECFGVGGIGNTLFFVAALYLNKKLILLYASITNGFFVAALTGYVKYYALYGKFSTKLNGEIPWYLETLAYLYPLIAIFMGFRFVVNYNIRIEDEEICEISSISVLTSNHINNIISNAGTQTNEMDLELYNVNVLYTKIHRIHIKGKHQEIHRNLRVCIEMNAGPVGRMNLYLRISDDSNLCPLFISTINEEDFKDLKYDQDLLMNFNDFPVQLKLLLDDCHASSAASSSKYLCELHEKRAVWYFCVVEPKPIKNVCLLFLKMSPANDIYVRKFLTLKIKQLRDDINSKTHDIIAEKKNLKEVNNENQQLKIEKNRILNQNLELQRTTQIVRLEVENHYKNIIKQMKIDHEKKLKSKKINCNL